MGAPGYQDLWLYAVVYVLYVWWHADASSVAACIAPAYFAPAG